MFSWVRDWLAEMFFFSCRAGELGVLVEDQIVLEPAWHGLSRDHDDAIDAKWHREDAIAATASC